MGGTTISIYDAPSSVNVNDPEGQVTVYEMFIGVGPTGPTGATGPAGLVDAVVCTGAEINTGTNDEKWASPKAIADSNIAFITDIPVKATGAEVNTGTDDAKFVTAKAVTDSNIAMTSDIPVKASAAEVATGTEDAKFVTPSSLKGKVKTISGPISNPQAWYTQRPQFFIMRTNCAITITGILIDGSDNTPTSEMALDLKFADDPYTGSFANATVIDVLDTTSGKKEVTSGFDDATVPSGKYVYLQWDASPHADWKDFLFQLSWTED